MPERTGSELTERGRETPGGPVAPAPAVASRRHAGSGAQRPAIYLDRDGTLVRDVRQPAAADALELLPGVGPALRALQEAGYALVVVTNQGAIARGLLSVEGLAGARARLVGLLAAEGVTLAGHYHCPHHPHGVVPELTFACLCRKPAPGMLFAAAAELRLALGRSWLFGDTLSDAAAARAAGVRPILIDIGHEAVDQPLANGGPLVARSIAHAALLVLADTGRLSAVPHPVAPAVLERVPPMDARAPGEHSPWPDEAHGVQAVEDARLLDELLSEVTPGPEAP